MVDLAVPEIAVVFDVNDPHTDEPVGHDVHRRCVVCVDPRLCCAHRIGLRAEVHVVDRVVDIVIDDLHRLAVDLQQADERRLELVACLPGCFA